MGRSYTYTSLPIWDLARMFVGRRVRVTTKDGIEYEGEFRGIWRDSVPYFPNILTPAVWVTKWGEFFTPVAEIESIETVERPA